MVRRNRKESRKAKGLSDQFHKSAQPVIQSLSENDLDAEARRLLAKVSRTLDVAERAELMNKMIATTGTDMERNKADPYGDGDQTPLATNGKGQVFRTLWSEGFDSAHCVAYRRLDPFSHACSVGDLATVQRILRRTPRKDLPKLLELRSTVFRLSPLLLTMGFGKHERFLESIGVEHPLDHVGVARVLLKAGARPDAKDVAGHTAVHFGAGVVSNEATRRIADWCIEAATTCRFFGEKVRLDDLTNEAYNGRIGILGGYDVNTGRRVVLLEENGTEKELAILPSNIFVEDMCIMDRSIKLVDVSDRMGATALFEVVMGTNDEAAIFLCQKHDADVDTPDISGITARYMSTRPMLGMETNTMHIVKQHCCKKAVHMFTCDFCSTESGTMSKCSRCGEAWYCNRQCQVSDWKSHKLVCGKSPGIVLARPEGAEAAPSFTMSRKGVFEYGNNEGYCKPQGVEVNEFFWVKVQRQRNGRSGAHLLYDKTRECNFRIAPCQPGFDELEEKILAEQRALGLKAHFKVKWNKKDELVIYPDSADLFDW